MNYKTPYSISTLQDELADQIDTVDFYLKYIERNPDIRIDYKLELEKTIEISNCYIKDLKMAIETLS